MRFLRVLLLSVTLESQNEILLRIVARSLEIIIFSKWLSFLFLSDAFSLALNIKINPAFFRDCRNDIHCQTVNIFLFRILYRSDIPNTFLVYTLFINKQRICSVEAQSRVAVISTFQNSKATMLATA